MTTSASNPTEDYDSPWKLVVHRFFPLFLAFFFPDAFNDIDWDRGYEFLDKELQEVVRDAELGRHLADVLVRVWRRSGEEAWVLVHVEIQATPDTAFGHRMYVYNYRLFDRYNCPVVSLAVLADGSPTWRPQSYGYALWGCKAELRFPIVKLLDYESRWQELEESDNPFALVVMTHLKALATHRDYGQRLYWKLELVKGLYSRGWSREDVLELFRFIDWMMRLPEELEKSFERTLSEFEGEKMPYVTSIERNAMKRGMEEGIVQQLREGIMETLYFRFGEAAAAAAGVVEEMQDTAALKTLHRMVVTAGTFEEVQRLLSATRG